MNKNVVLGIGVGLIVGGLVVFFLMRPTNSPVNNEKESQSESSTATTRATLRQISESNGSQKCTSKDMVDGMTLETTLYAANKKLRGTITAKNENMSFINDMIIEEDTLYMWSNVSNQGFKIPITESDKQTNGKIDLDSASDFTCSPWNADASFFVLPSNIQFK